MSVVKLTETSRRLAVAMAAGLVVAFSLPRRVGDFGNDWLTVKAFTIGLDPYQPIARLAELVGGITDPWNFQPWVHPRLPGVILLQWPISLLSYEQLLPVMLVMVTASAVFCMWVVGRISSRPWVIYTTPILLLIWPFSRSLLGQTGFWIAGLIGLAWLLGDRWLSGVPLGVAVMWKMWPWLLVPALWLSGRKKTAYGAAATFGLLNLGGLSVGVPLEGVVEMLSGGHLFLSWSLVTWLGIPTWYAAIIGLVGVIVVWRVQPARLFEWSIVIGLLVAPVLWPDYLPALFVPLAIWAGGRSTWSSRSAATEPSAAILSGLSLRRW